jgi:hypothetical protein
MKSMCVPISARLHTLFLVAPGTRLLHLLLGTGMRAVYSKRVSGNLHASRKGL